MSARPSDFEHHADLHAELRSLREALADAESECEKWRQIRDIALNDREAERQRVRDKEAELRALREENERLTREAAERQTRWGLCHDRMKTAEAERDAARRERDGAREVLLASGSLAEDALELAENMARGVVSDQHQRNCRSRLASLKLRFDRVTALVDDLRKRGGIAGTEGSGT